MSSTDNTRDKLVASMRKSKAGTPSTPEAAADKPAAAKPAAAAAKKPAATKKAPARKTTAKPAAPRKPAARPAAGGADPYQAGRRIWPD